MAIWQPCCICDYKVYEGTNQSTNERANGNDDLEREGGRGCGGATCGGDPETANNAHEDGDDGAGACPHYTDK